MYVFYMCITVGSNVLSFSGGSNYRVEVECGNFQTAVEGDHVQ
jgi:hypothetical protein